MPDHSSPLHLVFASLAPLLPLPKLPLPRSVVSLNNCHPVHWIFSFLSLCSTAPVVESKSLSFTGFRRCCLLCQHGAALVSSITYAQSAHTLIIKPGMEKPVSLCDCVSLGNVCSERPFPRVGSVPGGVGLSLLADIAPERPSRVRVAAPLVSEGPELTCLIWKLGTVRLVPAGGSVALSPELCA